MACEDGSVMYVVNGKNERIRVETGWSIFKNNDSRVMVSWLLRIVSKETPISDLGRDV